LSFYPTVTRQKVATLQKAKEKRIMDKQEAAAAKRTIEEAALMLAPPVPKRISFKNENNKNPTGRWTFCLLDDVQ